MPWCFLVDNFFFFFTHLNIFYVRDYIYLHLGKQKHIRVTTLAVIVTGCIDSCKSNYHTITTTFLLIFDYHEMNFKPVRYFGSPLIWDFSQE